MLKRLHRVSYAPVIALLSDCYKGIEVIKAFRAKKKIEETFFFKLDGHFGVHLISDGVNKMYSVALSVCGHVIFGVFILYMLMYKNSINVQTIGVILETTEDLIFQMTEILSKYITLETSMIAMERCVAILDFLEKEKTGFLSQGIGMKSEGNFVFFDFWVKYFGSKNWVLEGGNLEVKTGEKLGLRGKNGSGKSSIVLCLGKVLEGKKGKIMFDNKKIEIGDINIQYLRRNISIVSQDSLWMEGRSIYENVFPYNPIYSTNKNTINNTNTKNTINNTSNTSSEREKNVQSLESLLAFFGLKVDLCSPSANLSKGEIQTFCFFRAVLRDNKILILDEATSHMDENAQEKVKAYIQNHMKDKTILLISHQERMFSICDRVLEVKNGKIE